jgi:hypothetical protein
LGNAERKQRESDESDSLKGFENCYYRKLFCADLLQLFGRGIGKIGYLK